MMARFSLPTDVVRLVKAARNVAYSQPPAKAQIKELDEAAEAFADRIAWENDDVEY